MSSLEPWQAGGPAAAPTVLDWLNGDVAMLRREYERQRAKPMPTGATWMEVEADGRIVRVLAHAAPGLGDAVIVYFHGGGFIVGSPLTHTDITAALCRESGLPLYSVNYRLAPDFVAPAPVEDGAAVVAHLVERGVGKIILCGDSAGGAIALALEGRLPQALRPHVVAVCGFYGAHGRLDSPSLLARGNRADGTDAACVGRYFELANGGTGQNLYSAANISRPSPVPIYLLAAADDPLLGDSFEVAEALRAHGRTVVTDVVEGENHGFLHNVDASATAATAMQRVAAWIADVVRRA
jgi:acetyl esterase